MIHSFREICSTPLLSRWKSVSAQDRKQQQFHEEHKSQEAQKEEEDQPEQAQIRRKSKKDQRRDHFEQMAAERVDFWNKEIDSDTEFSKLIVKLCVVISQTLVAVYIRGLHHPAGIAL